MRKHTIYLFVVFLCIVTCGDTMVYSPYQSNLPKDAMGLTAYNLYKLQELPVQKEFKVALIADTENSYEDLETVVDIINVRNDVSFVFVLGDITNMGLRDEFLWFHDIAKKLRVPYLTVIGNHDSISNGKDIYSKMFGPFNYSFSFSGTRFIALNSNNREFLSNVPDLDYLLSELQYGALSDNIIVFSHVPSFLPDNGLSLEELNAWQRLMEDHNVKFSIHGHNHTFSSEIKNNLHYIVVPRVKNVQYGILSISGSSVQYEHCFPACVVQ